MILSDVDIAKEIESGRIKIVPKPLRECFQPASVDLTLGDDMMEFGMIDYIDPDWTPKKEKDRMMQKMTKISGDYKIFSGCFALGTTKEHITVPDNMVARIEGKSSLGRLGLMIHATAGFIDPGFQGNITLEFSNLAPVQIRLRPGMKIAQVAFEYLTTSANRPYGHPDIDSHYQSQTNVTPSRYGLHA